MINVRAFAEQVESLATKSRIPSVAEQRPDCCPRCQNPAYPPGGRLGIVGHGTYERQVLGLGTMSDVVIHVRRFLCLACERTISVLPDSLLPGRWYAGTAILAVLVSVFLVGDAIAGLRDSIGPGGRAPHWTSPGRWMNQLGERLWSWRAREIGYRPGIDRDELLGRLIGLAGAHARSPDRELEAAARHLVTDTSHALDGVVRNAHAR